VKDSEFQYDTFPGQPIRFPVEDKGRFEPLTINKWIKDFSISPPDVAVHVADEPDKESQDRYKKLGSGGKP
jgi:N-acyl-D-glutamate deacylase